MPIPIKWTPDFELVNLENPEGEPWLSASPDGRFSLVFFETPPGPPAYTDLEERIYTAAGVEQIAIGTTFSSATIEHQPASAYLPDGRRIIVWTEEPTAGGGNLEDVYAEIRFGNNIINAPRFLVTGGAGRQHDPVVAANSNGFAVAVADDSVAGGRLILKFYNVAGTLINTVLAPNTPQTVALGSADQFRDVEIVALANGNYVIVWDNTGNQDTFARVYSSGGVAQSGVIDVQTGAPNAAFPDVTALADGRFVVTYAEYVGGPVRGRFYQTDGTSDGLSFAIGSGAANDTDGQVQTAALHDGRFVTVWKTIAGEIAGQVMFANGTADGAAFTVNTVTAGDQSRPTIATLADGRFAVSWESGAGANPETIVTTIFDPREAGLLGSASSFDDDWVGTNFADQIFGGTGRDTLRGAGAVDILRGEAGNDTLFGDAGNDLVYGGNNDDTLSGDEGNDTLDGGGGSDTLNGGAGDDFFYVDSAADAIAEGAGEGTGDRVFASVSYTLGAGDQVEIMSTTLNGGTGAINLTGNEFANAIYGNAGANTLNGAGGVDSLIGFGGNDFFFVENAGDAITEGSGEGTGDRVFASVSYTLGAGDQVEIMSTTNNAGTGAINLTGNEFANTIYGNAGVNVLNGKAGVDTLVGFGGADFFLFDTALNAATNIDAISGFSVADDAIRLDNAIFTAAGASGVLAAAAFRIGTAAADASDRIIYNSATGALIYDSNGNAGGGATQFATLAAALAMTNADFVVV